MDDQRAESRIPCDIILNKVEDGHTKICRSVDLSLGGMRLRRVAEFFEAQGDAVQLQFALPGELEPIWVTGQKVHEVDGTLGVRFTNISHGHFVRLRNWLREQEQVELSS